MNCGQLRRDAKKPKPPTAAELTYRRILRKALEDVQSEILSYLEPKLREDAKIPKRFLFVVDPRELDLVYGRVDLNNEREQQKLIGIKSPVPKGLRDAFRRENVKLVKSIAQEQLDQLTRVLDVGFREGKRVETIRDEIEERFGVARSRADLIARDQVLKLNAELTKTRQTAAGIEEYVWSTSKDGAVRPEHEALEGTRQRWDDPPDTGNGNNHPGEDIQCRCDAIPILPWE